MRRWTTLFLILGLLAGVSLADDAKEMATEAATDAAMDAMGEMAMDPAMMAAMERMAPGEEHKFLDHLVGEWAYDISMWMGPEPTKTSGTMSAEWVMDGRFVQSTWKGEFLGQPFVGRGLDGFNRTSGEYESVWMDTMSTGLMSFTGHRDGDSLVLEGDNWDAMTGEKSRTRSVATFREDGSWHTVSYAVAEDGSETKQMEIVARRQ